MSSAMCLRAIAGGQDSYAIRLRNSQPNVYDAALDALMSWSQIRTIWLATEQMDLNVRLKAELFRGVLRQPNVTEELRIVPQEMADRIEAILARHPRLDERAELHRFLAAMLRTARMQR